MDLDDADSTAGQLSMAAFISFRPDQLQLIEAVERQVAAGASNGTCTVGGVSKPAKPFK